MNKQWASLCLSVCLSHKHTDTQSSGNPLAYLGWKLLERDASDTTICATSIPSEYLRVTEEGGGQKGGGHSTSHRCPFLSQTLCRQISVSAAAPSLGV